MVSEFSAGNYRFIPSVFQYSAGAAALPGYEVERVRFDRMPKLADGFAKIADYIHKTEFTTYVGKVRFGKNGEWAQPRMLAVQYKGITGNDLDQWKKSGHVTVLAPPAYKTGDVATPFQDNRK